MSVNRYLPHVFVLPEDDANSDLANGFHLEIDFTRQMQVLPVAGGWHNVLGLFKSEHIAEMKSYPHRFMVLLIDFDNDADRLARAKTAIPDDLSDRVFILGVLSEPEALKSVEGRSYEGIGSKLAQDCREEIYTTWGHDLLQHNASELDRLRTRVRSILF